MSNCPEWEFNPKSKIIDLFSSVYEELFCKKAKILVLHAGLECGAISMHYPDLDMISIGPNIYDVHTPKEKMEIASVEKDRKSTRLNSSHITRSRMPSSA